MSIRMRNNLVAIGVGTLVAVPLAGLGAALDGAAPHGTTMGFLVRTVPLLLAIPALLFVFNFLCERWERHGQLENSLRSRRRLDRLVLSSGRAEGGLTVGSVTQINDSAESPARGTLGRWHLDWSRRNVLPQGSSRVAGQ